MKKIGLMLLIMISTTVVFAQKIDEERMERDLEVAKNILSTLMKGESDNYFGGGSSIDASYVDGYGVIFTIPRHYVYFNARPPRPPKKGKGWTVVAPTDEPIVITELYGDSDDVEADNEKLSKKERAMRAEEKKAMEKIMKEQQMLMEVEMKKMEKEAKLIEVEAREWEEQYSQEMEKQNQHWEQAMVTFLADYADLIGQLKPEEKIMINQQSPHDDYVLVWDNAGESEGEMSAGISMEVSKKDITAYKTGNINLDNFKEKIVFKKKEPKKRQADLEMFASIFKQYYSPKLSKTFFTEGTPTYELLDNFGVIFNVKTYSSYVEGKLYYMPVLGDDKVSSDERKETIEELYPKFETELKSFIVDYGRTIRSLEDNEMLILKIKMTRCEDCSIPKSIDVSVKMSELKKYDQQKITREKAIASIEVKKNN